MSDADIQWQSTEAALRRAVLLVIVPGMLFAFGLIYFLSPPRAPLSVVNGCYKIDNGPIIMISPPFMKIIPSDLSKRNITIKYGKPSFQIEVSSGTSFKRGTKSRIFAKDEQFTNTLIGINKSRKGFLTLSLFVDDTIVDIPKVDCQSGRLVRLPQVNKR